MVRVTIGQLDDFVSVGWWMLRCSTRNRHRETGMSNVPNQIIAIPTNPGPAWTMASPADGARYFKKSENRSSTKPKAMIAMLVFSHARNVRSLARCSRRLGCKISPTPQNQNAAKEMRKCARHRFDAH